MNDERLIHTIQKLKHFSVDNDSLHRVRDTVFLNIAAETKALSTLSPYSYSFFGARLAVLSFALILISAFGGGALSNNPYHNSVTALSIVDYQHDALVRSHEFSPTIVFALERAVGNALETIGTLNIEGVPGLYTQAQCEEIYHHFHTLLEEIDAVLRNDVDSSTRSDIIRLRGLVQAAHDEAEYKLALYPKM